jgi:hypothetical protein
MINITPKDLRRAADIQEKLLGLREELQAILGVSAEEPATQQTTKIRRKHRMSAAGRRSIAAAARARWAAFRQQKESALPVSTAEAQPAVDSAEANPITPKKKRKMSPEGRARIAAAARARWAKIKAPKA